MEYLDRNNLPNQIKIIKLDKNLNIAIEIKEDNQ